MARCWKALGLAVLLSAGADFANADDTRPSFDCTKAGTSIDKMVCGDAELAKADRELAELYARLQRELSPASFATVREVQRAWLAGRSACTPGHKVEDKTLTEETAKTCLAERYGQEASFIDLPVKPLGGGLTLEARLHTRKWRRPDTDESDRIPWLVGTPAATAAAFNQAVLAIFRLDRHPFANAGFDNEPDLHFDYDRDYVLHHVDARLISLQVTIHHEGNIGHGWREEQALNWDVARNRPLDLDGLFTDDKWKAAVVEYAINDQKGEMQDPASTINETSVDDAGAWVFDDDGVVIGFDHFERSMVSGGPEVEIPYDVLKPFLRPDAPLPVKQ